MLAVMSCAAARESAAFAAAILVRDGVTVPSLGDHPLHGAHLPLRAAQAREDVRDGALGDVEFTLVPDALAAMLAAATCCEPHLPVEPALRGHRARHDPATAWSTRSKRVGSLRRRRHRARESPQL